MEQEPRNGWTLITLKEYFERVIADMNNRICKIDNANFLAKEKERSFYSREQHDTFANTVQKQFDQVHEEVEAIRRPQWSLWFPAMALLFTVISGAWYFATQPLQLELQHQKDRDSALEDRLANYERLATDRSNQRAKASEERDAATNNRIDRLYELYRDLQQQHSDILTKNKKAP